MKTSENRKYIKIRGANEHNLKNIDVDIPRDEFVVLTGLSGSGKSSLAFDHNCLTICHKTAVFKMVI